MNENLSGNLEVERRKENFFVQVWIEREGKRLEIGSAFVVAGDEG